MTDIPNETVSVTGETRGAVRLVRVDDAKANAFSVPMLDALSGELDAAEADADIGAMVICGNDRAFFAGFDLGVIRSGDRDAINELVSAGGELVRRVYGSSLPVVAACTGHAVAAGALFLLGCAHRVGPASDSVKIGLNEVAIGLTLPDWALAVAADRLSKRHLQRCVVNAQLCDGPAAVDVGYLDETVSPDAVIDRAMAVATQLAETLDDDAYANTVAALRGDVLARMSQSISPSAR